MTEVCVSDTLVLAECFGPTFQGEGPSTGRVASFIRLGGCNLVCKWCDSRFTWDGKRYDLRAELQRTPVDKILDQVDEYETDLVVITGGEPLLHQQQDGWRRLLDGLDEQGRRVEVETNGTVLPDSYTTRAVTAFNVSPKLAHAGMPESKRIRPEVLTAFKDTGKAAFKFVCRTADDVEAVFKLTWPLGIYPSQVWIMPEGTTAETLSTTTGNVVQAALRYRFNFSTRMHVLLWGNERGH